jgi:hypothetical protein
MTLVLVLLAGCGFFSKGMAYETDNYSIESFFETQSVSMSDFAQANKDYWTGTIVPTLVNNASLYNASSYSTSSSFKYPIVFVNLGGAFSYKFAENWVISLRSMVGGTHGVDTAEYADNAGVSYSSKSEWRFNTTDRGAGIGYILKSPHSRNTTVFRLFAGQVTVKHENTLSEIYDLRSVGRSRLTAVTPVSNSYTKAYYEPSFQRNIFFSRNFPLALGLKAGYIMVESEDLSGYKLDITGLKLGLALSYNW